MTKTFSNGGGYWRKVIFNVQPNFSLGKIGFSCSLGCENKWVVNPSLLNRVQSVTYIMCIMYVSKVYSMCILCVSNVHLMCIQCLSSVYPMGSECVSNVYPMCIQCVSNVYMYVYVCVCSVSKVNPMWSNVLPMGIQ